MNRFLVCVLSGMALFSFSFAACSKQEEGEEEKGKIEQMTDEVADHIVTKIKTPMDRARSVKQQEFDRAKAMDEAAEETLDEK